jgi:undecaprenyl-diphosphatase
MKTGHKTAANMTVKDSLIIGACQAVATIPGISRSGSTITAGMAVGIDRTYAVKFSFHSLCRHTRCEYYQPFQALGEGIDFSLLPAYLVGMIVAGVFRLFLNKTCKDTFKAGEVR